MYGKCWTASSFSDTITQSQKPQSFFLCTRWEKQRMHRVTKQNIFVGVAEYWKLALLLEMSKMAVRAVSVGEWWSQSEGRRKKNGEYSRDVLCIEVLEANSSHGHVHHVNHKHTTHHKQTGRRCVIYTQPPDQQVARNPSWMQFQNLHLQEISEEHCVLIKQHIFAVSYLESACSEVTVKVFSPPLGFHSKQTR